MFNTEIHIKGKLGQNWAGWFDEMQIEEGIGGETVLYGNLSDKSAVYGVLSRLSSLGISLISVNCREEDDEDDEDEDKA